MDEEVKKILEDHEKRLQIIENTINEKGVKKKVEDDFSSLSGGLRFLIHSGFFGTPKSFKEIQDELRKEGYTYPSGSVNTALTRDFVNKQKLLIRIKEQKMWKYAIRK